jgi:hypothetical protein
VRARPGEHNGIEAASIPTALLSQSRRFFDQYDGIIDFSRRLAFSANRKELSSWPRNSKTKAATGRSTLRSAVQARA